MSLIVGYDDGSSQIVGVDEVAARALRGLGMRLQSRETARGCEYRCVVPAHLSPSGRVAVVRAFGANKREEVGARFGRKLVKAGKKLAKNKVLRAVTKRVLDAAEYIPVYGQAVSVARKGIAVASKAARAGKKAKARLVKLSPRASKAVSAAMEVRAPAAKAARVVPKKARASNAPSKASSGKVVTLPGGKKFRVIAL